MDKNLILIGIDLGTTNSEIAVFTGTDFELITNSYGDLYTPSVFGVNKRKNEEVGKEAYNALFKDSNRDNVSNYKAEVKRLMGTSNKIYFPRIDKNYLPEDISAEILKSLKNDLLRRFPTFNTMGVVITVPANFDTVQNEATKRAAYLAGFEFVALVQEPIAAAIAYGFSQEKEDTWLVYDLGGGTFDTALITSKGGVLRVIEHQGDNFLGGKDIDELLIEKVIKPQILKRYRISDFSKRDSKGNENGKYKSAFNILKYIAENAKIKLSTSDTVEIDISKLGILSDDNDEIDFYFTYSRKEFEKLIEPIVQKTIELSKLTIEKANIRNDEVSKIVFVGAATQTPYIRKRIENELGIMVDTSVNPFTVVAKGAAIYGSSQRIPQEILDKHYVPKGENDIRIELNYDPMCSDDEQLVTGKILNQGEELFIKISSESGFFNSDKVTVKNGTFLLDIPLEKKKKNVFWLYVLDSKGNILQSNIDSFSITQGLSISGAPIPRAIGVIYAIKSLDSESGWENTCDIYFKRSSIPSLEETKTFKTISEIKKGENVILPILIYEGDSEIPDHNEVITRVEISGEDLPYNLPKNSDIDIRLHLDESRQLYVEVYIPLVDMTLNARVDTFRKDVEIKDLEKTLKKEETTLKSIESNISPEENHRISSKIESIKSLLKNNTDTDSKQKADKELREIQSELHNLSSSTKLSRLVETYELSLSQCRDAINDISKNEIKEQFQASINTLQAEGKDAINKSNEDALNRVIDILDELKMSALRESPQFWVGMLLYFDSNRHIFTNQTTANSLLSKAMKSLQNNDIDGLKESLFELSSLIRRDAKENIPSNIAGVTKW